MAEQAPTPAATPTPAPALAPSPAVQQRMAAETDLVEIDVYGVKQLVPVSVAKRDYQTYKASQQALAEAKRIRSEQHVDREHAERWRQLEYGLRTNPEQALAGLERLSGVTRSAQIGDSDVAPAAAPSPNTRETENEKRIRHLEAVQHQNELKATNRAALDAYPVFQQDARVRAAAEKQLLALEILDPNVDVNDAVREIHADLLAFRSGSATQIRDTRVERGQALPNIPANMGMPDLSDIPQGKDSDTKDGTFRQRFIDAARRFGAGAVGSG